MWIESARGKWRFGSSLECQQRGSWSLIVWGVGKLRIGAGADGDVKEQSMRSVKTSGHKDPIDLIPKSGPV